MPKQTKNKLKVSKGERGRRRKARDEGRGRKESPGGCGQRRGGEKESEDGRPGEYYILIKA